MSDGNVNNRVRCMTVATQTVFSHSLFVSSPNDFFFPLSYSAQAQRSFLALESIFGSFFLLHCHSRSYSSVPVFPSFAVNPSVFGVYHFLLLPPLPFFRHLSWINAALAAATFQLGSCLPLCDPPAPPLPLSFYLCVSDQCGGLAIVTL